MQYKKKKEIIILFVLSSMRLPSVFLITFLVIFQLKNQVIYSCNHYASCGCSNKSQLYSKIVGGQSAKRGTWSWVVSLRVQNRFLCAGSILTSSWILTAAHCFSIVNNLGTNVFRVDPSDITVHAGSNNQYEETQLRRVANITFHPKFDETNFINDIALLKLSSSLHMTDVTLATICLPSVSRNEYPPVDSSVSKFCH
jgi:secreted trypsin-like serine protease